MSHSELDLDASFNKAEPRESVRATVFSNAVFLFCCCVRACLGGEFRTGKRPGPLYLGRVVFWDEAIDTAEIRILFYN